RLPDLWFDPSDLRNPWRLASAEQITVSVAESAESATPSGPLGQRYRAANENTRRKRAEPFEVDPDQLDQATQLHAATQNALSAVVEIRGREPVSPTGEPNYDLAWEEPDGSVVVVEVKSLRSTNAERQLRLGLGQVLRYRSLLEADGRKAKSVLALSAPPHDPRWVALCDQLGVSLIWMPNLDTMLDQALGT
ncbi:MAG TPA: hypothetical protein VHS55_09680, partial [Solirubrobacteraceae bacterium]|nr:hypothetical protein [Solirubrobacteraceae bacterium]